METEFIKNINVWSPEIIILLLASGFLTGIVNTLAGSGTVIGYAVFMSLGLPPAWANGTVRLGVIPQTFAAGLNFYRHKLLDIKSSLFIIIPVTAGSVAGAFTAISIDEDVFKKIVGAAMLVILFFLIFKPEKFLSGNTVAKPVKFKAIHLLIYFLIGLYGGFIHIGVGIFLLIALVAVSGFDLVKANSLKVFIVFVYTPFALAVFMINGEIHYAAGLIAALGNTLGGIFSSKYAIKRGAGLLRRFLIAVIIFFSAYLFGFFDFLKDRLL